MQGSFELVFFNFINLFEVIIMTTKYESRIMIIFILRKLKIQPSTQLRTVNICSYLLFFLIKGRKHYNILEICFIPLPISLLFLPRANRYHYHFICVHISSLFFSCVCMCVYMYIHFSLYTYMYTYPFIV